MFNNYVKSIICLGILILSDTCFSQTKLIQNLSNGVDQKVLCFGTSNYVNATPYAGGTWIPQVESALNEMYTGTATLIVAGLSGQNSTGGSRVIAGYMDTYDPDVIVMGFAINDNLVPETRTCIESMVADIREHNSEAEIIFFNIVSPENVYPDFPGRDVRPDHEEILRLWDTIAKEQGILHVNLYDEWEYLRVNDNATYLSYVTEGVHMNPAGNLAITTPGFIEAITAPEPTTVCITAAGLFGILRRRKKRHQ